MKKIILLILMLMFISSPVYAKENKLYFTENNGQIYYESKLLDESSILSLLQSEEYASDTSLPTTGVPYEMERVLSAQFVKMGKEYGTVNTSAVLWRHDGEVIIKERRTIPSEETTVKFQIRPDF